MSGSKADVTESGGAATDCLLGSEGSDANTLKLTRKLKSRTIKSDAMDFIFDWKVLLVSICSDSRDHYSSSKCYESLTGIVCVENGVDKFKLKS